MRTTIYTIITMIATTTTAFAADGEIAEGTGALCWLFFGFCALVVACQMIPATMLGTAAVKAITSKPVPVKAEKFHEGELELGLRV